MKFSIIKREPPYFFENIHEDLNRFLKDTFRDLEFIDPTQETIKRTHRPAVEIKEKRDRYLIKIELPNVNKENIDVELRENGVSIQAESRFEECKEDENLKTTEFRYGSFSRIIPLEQPINKEDAKCEFKDGILKINIAKLHEDKKEDIKKLHID